MKLYSQEALFAGGVYTVLSYPPAYFQNPIAESFSFLLTGVFVILLFFLFFNKVPSVISHAFRQYPVLSYYLVSFGWVPYFMIAGIVFCRLPPPCMNGLMKLLTRLRICLICFVIGESRVRY